MQTYSSYGYLSPQTHYLHDSRFSNPKNSLFHPHSNPQRQNQHSNHSSFHRPQPYPVSHMPLVQPWSQVMIQPAVPHNSPLIFNHPSNSHNQMVRNYQSVGIDQRVKPQKQFQTLVSNNKLQHINEIFAPSPECGGVYIGDSIATKMPNILDTYKISGVLCCNKEASNNLKQIGRQLFFKYINIEDSANAQIKSQFQHSFNFIQFVRIQGNVLIQCHAGVSRSGTILCAYLMKKHNWNVFQALSFCRQKRKRINPNKGFYEQLLQYERQLKQAQKQKDQQPKKKQEQVNKAEQSRKQSLNPEKNYPVESFHDRNAQTDSSANYLRSTISHLPEFLPHQYKPQFYSPQKNNSFDQNNFKRSLSPMPSLHNLSNSRAFQDYNRNTSNSNRYKVISQYKEERIPHLQRNHHKNVQTNYNTGNKSRRINLSVTHKMAQLKRF